MENAQNGAVAHEAVVEHTPTGQPHFSALYEQAKRLEAMGVELSADLTGFDTLAWKCKGIGNGALKQIVDQCDRLGEGVTKDMVVAGWCKELLRAQAELWRGMCGVKGKDREKFMRRWGDVRREVRRIRRMVYPAALRRGLEHLQGDRLVRDAAVSEWVLTQAALWEMVGETLGKDFERMMAILAAKAFGGVEERDPEWIVRA